MNDLPNELFNLILYNVEFRDIKNKCSLVCKNWNKIINDKKFIKHLFYNNFINYPLKNQIILENELNLFKKLLDNIDFYHYLPIDVYEASSFDHPTQHQIFSITLNDNLFWSSKGTETQSTDDYITYGINDNIGVITAFKIVFFRANYIAGKPCFPSEFIRIEIKNSKNKSVFKSEKYSVKHNNSTQIFYFDKPIFITKEDRVILHLIGKKEKQYLDNKYYVCINSFNLIGISGLDIGYKIVDNSVLKITNYEKIASQNKIFIIQNHLFYLAEWLEANNISRENEEIFSHYLDQLGRGITNVII